MIALHESSLELRVRHAISQLVEGADRLRGLAEILEELGATPGNAEPPDLRRAVVGIQAAAMQALLMAATAVGLSERLSTIAAIRESAEPNGAENSS
ncbi:MAG: hypothetical protein ACOY0T_29995 [Myxococcota bacterium]